MIFQAYKYGITHVEPAATVGPKKLMFIKEEDYPDI